MKIRLLSDNTGKKFRKEKEACDETLDDKPWAKYKNVSDFEDM